MNDNHVLTLSYVFQHPHLFTHKLKLQTGEELIFRPLKENDINNLTQFLEELSTETRYFSTFSSYDKVTAKEFCEAINKYDKLRFVLETITGKIIGLLEFSLSIPTSNKKRFENYGVALNENTDCRFGPTLADDYQDKGIGSSIMSLIIDIARKFGKERIILYGGVLMTNKRAIHFYEKHGFRKVGEFINSDKHEAIDMMLTK